MLLWINVEIKKKKINIFRHEISRARARHRFSARETSGIDSTIDEAGSRISLSEYANIRRPNNLSCPILSRPSCSVCARSLSLSRSAAVAARARNPLPALKLREPRGGSGTVEDARGIPFAPRAPDSARDRRNGTGGIVDGRRGATRHRRDTSHEPRRSRVHWRDWRSPLPPPATRLPRRRSRAPRSTMRRRPFAARALCWTLRKVNSEAHRHSAARSVYDAAVSSSHSDRNRSVCTSRELCVDLAEIKKFADKQLAWNTCAFYKTLSN